MCQDHTSARIRGEIDARCPFHSYPSCNASIADSLDRRSHMASHKGECPLSLARRARRTGQPPVPRTFREPSGRNHKCLNLRVAFRATPPFAAPPPHRSLNLISRLTEVTGGGTAPHFVPGRITAYRWSSGGRVQSRGKGRGGNEKSNIRVNAHERTRTPEL